MTPELAPLKRRAKLLNMKLDDERTTEKQADTLLDQLDLIYAKMSKIRNGFVNSQ